MGRFEALPDAFRPVCVGWEFPADEAFIGGAHLELLARAAGDTNHCYGYFPSLEGNVGVDTNLDASRVFASVAPTIDLDGHTLGFNFLRLSLIQQHADSPFHLDSDANTAISGDPRTISERLIWRLLLNLSIDHPRTLAYLDVNPCSVDLTMRQGYIHTVDADMAATTMRQLNVPPREGRQIQGALFCASRVLHTGQDDEHGHFVAGYGSEQPAS